MGEVLWVTYRFFLYSLILQKGIKRVCFQSAERLKIQLLQMSASSKTQSSVRGRELLSRKIFATHPQLHPGCGTYMNSTCTALEICWFIAFSCHGLQSGVVVFLVSFCCSMTIY